MNYMPHEIILARGMTALDLEFQRVLYYHDEGYNSNNDYGTHHRSQGLSMYTSYLQHGPPLTS